MAKIKKLLAMLVCMAMTLVVMPGMTAWAEDGVTDDGLWYEVYGDHVEITGYADDAEELDIPAEIEGLPVTVIGEDAFADCDSLTSVTIPDSVTNIGDEAFAYCYNLLSVTIPNSVTSIGAGAFCLCNSLTDVYYGGTKSQWKKISIKSGNDDMLNANIHYIGTVVEIPEGLEYIVHANGQYGGNAEITGYTGVASEIIIPDEIEGEPVKKIDSGAFESCENLTSVTIPESVTSIESAAFRNCTSLTRVNIPEDLTEISQYTFYNCTNLASVTIPNSLTEIGQYAFYNCTNLVSVSIPDTVTRIGDYAFYGCKSLESANIPSGVTEISDSLFRNCASLKDVIIPNSVTSIGSMAFNGCSNITNVVIPDGVANIDVGTFGDCINLKSVSIPDSVTSIGYGAFDGCSNLENINIPGRVTEIGEWAFANCKSLPGVTIPNGVTSIDGNAFYDCIHLAEIDIPKSVAYIGDRAFYFCKGLVEINVDADNEKYKSQDGVLFDKEMTKLIQYPIGNTQKSYSIPEGVTNIANSAFDDGTNLADIYISKSVTNIDENAFSYCTSLVEINVDSENKNYKSQDGVLFDKEMTKLIQYPIGNARTSYRIPDGVTEICKFAFCSSLKLKSVEIPYGVTSIDNDAFLYCHRLTSVIISNSVTNIGNSAFYGCTSLINMMIPDSVTNIGNSAFSGCTSLKEINVDANNEKYTSQNGILYNKEKTELVRFPAGNTVTKYTIPDGVMNIGEWAFSGCTSITNVDIPSGVTNISSGAFDGCRNLMSVTIPNSLTNISSGAFYECVSLTDIYYAGSEENWENISIDYFINAPLKSVTIHYNSVMPEPSAEPKIKIPEVTPDEATGALNVTVDTVNVPETAELVVISYGADGGLIDIAAVENGEAKLDGENAQTVKVFCWESLESMRPLCEAKEVEVTQ